MKTQYLVIIYAIVQKFRSYKSRLWLCVNFLINILDFLQIIHISNYRYQRSNIQTAFIDNIYINTLIYLRFLVFRINILKNINWIIYNIIYQHIKFSIYIFIISKLTIIHGNIYYTFIYEGLLQYDFIVSYIIY